MSLDFRLILRQIGIFLFVLLYGCSEKENLPSEISKVIKKQETAWNNGDIDAFMEGYWNNDSMQFITKNGIRYGWKQTLESYKKSYSSKEKMGQLSFGNLKIKAIDSKTGHATGTWHIARSADSLEGHFSLLFKQFKNGPRIIVDHTW